MSPQKNILALHSTVSKHSTLAMDVDIARISGFDALELSSDKLVNYLDAGYTEGELKCLLKGFDLPGVGFLADIERQGVETQSLMKEAESLFELAHMAGAKAVQILTGPINVRAVTGYHKDNRTNLYSGLLGYTAEKQVSLTAKNVAMLADLAKDFDLILYLEALSWTPLCGIEKQIKVLDRAERNNVKIVIDYWHCYTSGVTPDTIEKLDKDIIYGVHVCDSLAFDGETPNEEILRDVPTGSGVLNLEEWTEAIKSTGYDGWWSCELFSKKQQQQNSYVVAKELKKLLENLVKR